MCGRYAQIGDGDALVNMDGAAVKGGRWEVRAGGRKGGVAGGAGVEA